MYEQLELDQLVAAMRATGTTSLTVKKKGKKFRLLLPPGERQIAVPAAKPQDTVVSPLIGMFRPRGEDDGLPPIQPQDAVTTGDILGYVALGAVLMPVTAPATGRINSTLPTRGQLCGHGDILFTIEKAS